MTFHNLAPVVICFFTKGHILTLEHNEALKKEIEESVDQLGKDVIYHLVQSCRQRYGSSGN